MPVIIERDRAQAEVILPLEHYISRRLTATLIRTGREKFAEQKAMLEEISRSRRAGGDRRGRLGRRVELRPVHRRPSDRAGARDARVGPAALDVFPRRAASTPSRSSNRGDIDLPNMTRLVGRRDGPAAVHALELPAIRAGLRRRRPPRHLDVAGRHLRVDRELPEGHGWRDGQTWGREVKVLPEAAKQIAVTVARREGSCKAMRDMTVPLSLAEWQRLGVRTLGGGALPKAECPRRSSQARRDASSCIRTTMRCSSTTVRMPMR